METYSTSKVQSWLIWFLKGVMFLAGMILIARLVEVQVIKGEYFRELSENNRIRKVEINAPRGKILARGGEVMVDNREIKKLIEFDPNEGYIKIEVLSDVSKEQAIQEWEREYLDGRSISHIVGYIGEVKEDEIGKVDPQCPEKADMQIGQKVGRTGIEEYYNCRLTGIPGEEMLEVDSGGNKIAVLGMRDPIPGEDIQTTIDLPLQKRISYLMKDVQGAVVVTDTKGNILSLVSSPSYDPNYFVGKNQENIKSILENETLPLFNRATGGSFPPGSIYKPIVAMAGLEEGDIDSGYTYQDTGVVEVDTDFGHFSYKNWYFTQYGGTEGEIGVKKALARSTDTFFYKLGEALGPGNLLKWSKIFGLDQKTGIDIPGEIEGLIPSPGWKQEIKGERWFLGNTYHMSIGQGDLLVTPIGINRAISAIASKGKLCQTRLVNDPELDLRGENIDNCEDLELSEGAVDLVTEGMVDACSSGGTGFTFFDINEKADQEEDFLIVKAAGGDKKIKVNAVACKTGTAETGG
ncbi:hypothetical protein JXA63_03170, partial [Candidatus Woesebacteria bacterium]|nr:hypothetical protein [Candidatus Woesebacteria bacterium]